MLKVCTVYTLEFGCIGAGNHRDEDHLVAKLLEVVKYHLLQMCCDLVQASAMDPVLVSYSSHATSLTCHVQAGASVLAKTVVRKGKDLIELLLERACEIHDIVGRRELCIEH